MAGACKGKLHAKANLGKVLPLLGLVAHGSMCCHFHSIAGADESIAISITLSDYPFFSLSTAHVAVVKQSIMGQNCKTLPQEV